MADRSVLEVVTRAPFTSTQPFVSGIWGVILLGGVAVVSERVA
jgi:hypothetical protein